jgi:hypothetical protein
MEVVLAKVEITLQVIARFCAIISSLELKIAMKLTLAGNRSVGSLDLASNIPLSSTVDCIS